MILDNLKVENDFIDLLKKDDIDLIVVNFLKTINRVRKKDFNFKSQAEIQTNIIISFLYMLYRNYVDYYYYFQG